MHAFAQRQNQPQNPLFQPCSGKMPTPGPGDRVHPTLYLQRVIGNQAVIRMLQTHAEERETGSTAAESLRSGDDLGRIPVQLERKGSVSFPGDPFEREADDVADKVMRMTELASIDLSPSASPHKRTEVEDEERKAAQTKRAPSANTEAALNAVAAVRATERGGAPLSREVRSHFEVRFGRDFSGVRVHADGESANAAS
jgi:Domain of unknown function (DUF4157)